MNEVMYNTLEQLINDALKRENIGLDNAINETFRQRRSKKIEIYTELLNYIRINKTKLLIQ
jgi:hypothetical protein